MSGGVFIAGVAMTPFGRHLELSVKDLTAIAVLDALKDADLPLQAIQAACFGNTSQGYFDKQQMIRGQVALAPLGLQGIPVFNVENACATASTALHLAVSLVRSGAHDVVLAVGAEKMCFEDRDLMFGIFERGWDTETIEENLGRLTALGEGLADVPPAPGGATYSRFMDVYAAYSRLHMATFGLTQAQLAEVAAKNHRHSVDNPRAQFRIAMTAQEVLAARPVAFPLTVPMCAPISDGAAAAIVCSERALRATGGGARAVEILASAMRSATARSADEFHNHITRLTGLAAYEMAGLGPEDIDVAEVHDATAMGEILQTEMLGFCQIGGGGELAASGATALGGRLPINPSGGLQSKGHPVGATGLGQIFELVQQLRGECGPRQVPNARIALQENSGGQWGYEEACAHVGILAGPRTL